MEKNMHFSISFMDTKVVKILYRPMVVKVNAYEECNPTNPMYY